MQAVPSSEQELLSYLSWKRPKECMLTPWSGKQAWKYQHQEHGGWRLPPKCLSKASPLDRWLCWLLSDKHSHHSIFPAEEKQNGKGRSFSDGLSKENCLSKNFSQASAALHWPHNLQFALLGVPDYSHTTLGSGGRVLALPSQHRPSQDAQDKTQPWEWASVVP